MGQFLAEFNTLGIYCVLEFISVAPIGSRIKAPARDKDANTPLRARGSRFIKATNLLWLLTSCASSFEISTTLMLLVLANACTRGLFASVVPTRARDPASHSENCKARSSGETSRVIGGVNTPMV
ncbi:hypothetical protein SAMN05216227_103438 [Pseudorhodobacter antarcticus]|uniref:Uncharacterized protein n=1 Tax=Pseudorhodobacter antarcticus TaxID=1077947 RepID=A0A1H8KSK1_9RHOB|nr:hypothetical protein SAMN05216227_103438 [Pseudorhodobacter antarcticus]